MVKINFNKTSKLKKKLASGLNNFYEREKWVSSKLAQLPDGIKILDAGCGSQRFKNKCDRFSYYTQDFGEYVIDEKKSFTSTGRTYEYGKLDYISNIWEIPEQDNSFDAILCTEVLEHIPYPIETLNEFARLLKNGGYLILTAPSNCLRHMDPYFYYSGFSDNWFRLILDKFGFEIIEIEPVGDYYSWMKVELYRTISNGHILNKFIRFIYLLPAFLFFNFKTKTESSTNTLCMGYHVLARKKHKAGSNN